MLAMLRPRLRSQAAIEGIAIGVLFGLMDVHSSNEDWFDSLTAYPLAAFVLGVRHGRRAWQAWLPLGSSLYVLHLAAIACGYQPPYVEVDAETAGACLVVSWPVGLGLGLAPSFHSLFRSSQRVPGLDTRRRRRIRPARRTRNVQTSSIATGAHHNDQLDGSQYWE